MVTALRHADIRRARIEAAAGPFVGAASERLFAGAADDQLEPQFEDLTTLFVDLRGFTRFAKGRTATTVSETIQPYIAAIAEQVYEHDGVVMSYLGDGLMATFGWPRPEASKRRTTHDPYPDRVVNALRAALAIADAVDRLNASSDDRHFDIGVGVSTGPVFVDNVGFEKRVQTTVIGAAVNLAARLEKATKEAAFFVLASESTFDGAPKQRRGELPDDVVVEIDGEQLEKLSVEIDGERVVAYGMRPKPPPHPASTERPRRGRGQRLRAWLDVGPRVGT